MSVKWFCMPQRAICKCKQTNTKQTNNTQIPPYRLPHHWAPWSPELALGAHGPSRPREYACRWHRRRVNRSEVLAERSVLELSGPLILMNRVWRQVLILMIRVWRQWSVQLAHPSRAHYLKGSRYPTDFYTGANNLFYVNFQPLRHMLHHAWVYNWQLWWPCDRGEWSIVYLGTYTYTVHYARDTVSTYVIVAALKSELLNRGPFTSAGGLENAEERRFANAPGLMVPNSSWWQCRWQYKVLRIDSHQVGSPYVQIYWTKVSS